MQTPEVPSRDPKEGEAVQPDRPRPPVGEGIRALRRARGMSTAKLSGLAGVSAGMISQIERGISNPSIRILMQLADALGVEMSSLLERPADPAPALPREALPAVAVSAGAEERYIVRRVTNRPSFFVGSSKFFKELLSPTGHSKMQMMTIAMPPGSRSEDMVFGAGEKACFVIDGVLTLEVEGRLYQLGPGDSFQFDASVPHHIYNRTSETVKLFWIIALERRAPF